MGHALDGASVIACLAGDIRPAMVAALDQLKREGLKLGCITNNVRAGHGAGMAASDDKARAVEAIMARFDHVIESSKAGVRKPDPRIYQMMCEALAWNLRPASISTTSGSTANPPPNWAWPRSR